MSLLLFIGWFDCLLITIILFNLHVSITIYDILVGWVGQVSGIIFTSNWFDIPTTP